MGAVLLPLGIIATGGLSAAGSIAQSRQQRRALQASANSTARAASIQTGQVQDQAEQALLESVRERDRIIARSRVLAADAGLSFGDTQRDIEFSVAESAAEDRNAILRNLANENLRIQSGLDARMEELKASTSNTGLRAIGAFVEGGAAGLSIGQNIRSIRGT